MNEKIGLTRGELQQETGAPVSMIHYLAGENRLPYLKPPRGKGSITIYDPQCIEILKAHMNK